MERLTEKRDGQWVIPLRQDGKREWSLCSAGMGSAPTQFLYGDAANRLAAYEDTGLEPEEIYEVRFLIAAQRDPQKLARLRELVQAEQDGRLVVLPCKVCDHVWVDGREAIVVWFFGYKTERYLHTQFLDNAEYTDIPFYEIGKTVFLTREEAEAALAGKGGDG